MPSPQMQKLREDIRKIFFVLFLVFVGLMGFITLFAKFLAQLRMA